MTIKKVLVILTVLMVMGFMSIVNAARTPESCGFSKYYYDCGGQCKERYSARDDCSAWSSRNSTDCNDSTPCSGTGACDECGKTPESCGRDRYYLSCSGGECRENFRCNNDCDICWTRTSNDCSNDTQCSSGCPDCLGGNTNDCDAENDIEIDSDTCPSSVDVNEEISFFIDIIHHNAGCEFDFSAVKITLSGVNVDEGDTYDSISGSLEDGDDVRFGDPFKVTPTSVGELIITVKIKVDGSWITIDRIKITVNSTCTNECSSGDRQCASNTSYRECTQKDGCWIWDTNTSYSCGSEKICTGNGNCVCTNECSTFETGCEGDKKYTCGDANDGDSCLDRIYTSCLHGCSNSECNPCPPNWNCTAWSCSGNNATRTCTDSNSCGTNNGKPNESKICADGYACSSGECIATCTNKCSSGDKECASGTDYRNCVQEGNCWGWSSTSYSCGSEKICTGNGNCTCTDECSVFETGCEGDKKYTCGDTNDGDSCLDRIYTSCLHGCSNSECNPCPPNWQCTDWVCDTGNRVRLCNDSNSCDTDEGKPSEFDPCAESQICIGDSCFQDCSPRHDHLVYNGRKIYWADKCDIMNDEAEDCTQLEDSCNDNGDGIYTYGICITESNTPHCTHRDNIPCDNNYICSDANCIADCTDECSVFETGCEGDKKYTCGDTNDGDSCLDRIYTSCLHGCSNSECNPCPPNWQCTDWVCDTGNRVRLCNDSNSCDTDEGKPSEFDPCAESQICIGDSCFQDCTPVWVCTNWTCDNVNMIRDCADEANCDKDENKPNETKTCPEDQVCIYNSNGSTECQSVITQPSACNITNVHWSVSEAIDQEFVNIIIETEDQCQSNYSIKIYDGNNLLSEDLTGVIEGVLIDNISIPWKVAYFNSQFSWDNQDSEYYFEIVSDTQTKKSDTLLVKPKTLLDESLINLLSENPIPEEECADYGTQTMNHACIVARDEATQVGIEGDSEISEDVTFTTLGACTLACDEFTSDVVVMALCPEIGDECLEISSFVDMPDWVCPVCSEDNENYLLMCAELASKIRSTILKDQLSRFTENAQGQVFRDIRQSDFNSAISKTFKSGDDVIEYIVYLDNANSNQINFRIYKNAISSLEGGDKVLDFKDLLPEGGKMIVQNTKYSENQIVIKVFGELKLTEKADDLIKIISNNNYTMQDIVNDIVIDGYENDPGSFKLEPRRIHWDPISISFYNHDTGIALENDFLFRFGVFIHEGGHAVIFKRLSDDLNFKFVSPIDEVMGRPTMEYYNDMLIVEKLNGEELDNFKVNTNAKLDHEYDGIVDKLADNWYLGYPKKRYQLLRLYNLADKLGNSNIKNRVITILQEYASKRYINLNIIILEWTIDSQNYRNNADIFIENLFKDDFDPKFKEILTKYRIIENENDNTVQANVSPVQMQNFRVEGEVKEKGSAEIHIDFEKTDIQHDFKFVAKSSNITMESVVIQENADINEMIFTLKFGCDCSGAQEVRLYDGDTLLRLMTFDVLSDESCLAINNENNTTNNAENNDEGDDSKDNKDNKGCSCSAI